MYQDQNSGKYDTIPINYAGALLCACIAGLAWYFAPSADVSKKYLPYFIVAGAVCGMFGCFWHYRLDETGITQLYCGIRQRKLLWENVAQIGIIYTTTYAKGSGERYIVVIPKYCELPDPTRYNGKDYIQRNRKRIMKLPSGPKYVAMIGKYYGPMDF